MIKKTTAICGLLASTLGAAVLPAACGSDSKGNTRTESDAGSGGSSTGGASSADASTGGDGGEEAGAPTCGNGTADPGETCDIAIPAGSPGSCPTVESCDDQNPCTVDAVTGSECTQRCDNTAMVSPNAGDKDQCCPPGATFETDADCSATCGNGTLDDGETCDTAITSGAGACITACPDDGNACTRENLVVADPCNPTCSTVTITTAADGDSCCPSGATSENDDDCTPTAFRMTSLVMRDPHPFIVSGMDAIPMCTDLIDTFNDAIIAPALNGDTSGGPDGGPDGSADLNFVIVVRPEVHTGSAAAEFHQADCPMPSSGNPTSCGPRAGDAPTYFTYTNVTSGNCLEPDPGTVKPYDPPVPTTSNPCIQSSTGDLTLVIGGVTLPFKEAVFAAQWESAAPSTGAVNGVFKGFLSEDDAEAAMFSGLPISTLFPIHPDDACSEVDDSDVGPDGVTRGWWWYLTFEAERVTWSGP